MSRFKYGQNTIYNIGYHIIWIPKYRKAILKGSFKDIIKISLFDKARELDITIEAYEIMPDHIHLFIKCSPNHRVSDVVRQLKGYSSYMVRKSYPQYRKKYKSLWAPSYCESVGHISESTVIKYINDQTII